MATFLHRFANPGRFLRLTDTLLPWIGAGAIACMIPGLWTALATSPADYQQGETVRIMYVHVPAAWLALSGWAAMAIAGAVFLIWKHPLAGIAGRCIAPIGAAFTAVALATGSLWGQPMWGTWWVWDARLTSVLVLFFLYFGHIALIEAFDEPTTGERAASILALAGAINLPVIKFSVDWWNTLHQPASILRTGGPAIHPDMLLPLFLMAGGFTFVFAFIVLVRMQAVLTVRKAQSLQRIQLTETSGEM